MRDDHRRERKGQPVGAYDGCMRIFDLGAAIEQPVDRFGSTGFSVAPIARGSVTVAQLRLDPGGRIGRHDSVGEQLLMVLQGEAVVSGHDGVELRLGRGEAALWAVNESHETRTDTGLVAIAVEGDFTILLDD